MEIKGLGASKGTITAKASTAADFEEGDILIASMTTPDHLPIMKQASGFITEKGSVTCHAAIVAREMNKPCIVRVGFDMWQIDGQTITLTVEDILRNSITW